MLEASALCALHPDTPAAFICARCGSFGCEGCRSDAASTFCRACKAPLPTVLRGRLDSVSLIRDSLLHIFSRNLLGLWVLALVWRIADHLLSYVLTAALVSTSEDLAGGRMLPLLGLSSFIVGVFLHASFTWWMGEGFLGRRKRSLVTALLVGPASTPRLASLWIVNLAFLFFGFSCGMPLGLIMFLSWALALPGVVLDRLGAMAALRRTFELTQGHRWSLVTLFLCYFAARTLLVSALREVPSFLQDSSPFYLLEEFITALMAEPLRLILATALALFYLRRTQGAAHDSRAAEAVRASRSRG